MKLSDLSAERQAIIDRLICHWLDEMVETKLEPNGELLFRLKSTVPLEDPNEVV